MLSGLEMSESMAQPAGDQLRAQFATVHGKLHKVGQIWFLMVLMLSANARTNILPARWVKGGVAKISSCFARTHVGIVPLLPLERLYMFFPVSNFLLRC